MVRSRIQCFECARRRIRVVVINIVFVCSLQPLSFHTHRIIDIIASSSPFCHSAIIIIRTIDRQLCVSQQYGAIISSHCGICTLISERSSLYNRLKKCCRLMYHRTLSDNSVDDAIKDTHNSSTMNVLQHNDLISPSNAH